MGLVLEPVIRHSQLDFLCPNFNFKNWVCSPILSFGLPLEPAEEDRLPHHFFSHKICVQDKEGDSPNKHRENPGDKLSLDV